MNKRLLILGIALVAIVGVIAGVVWFVVLPGGNGEPAAAVVVNAPELEAADESQRVFRIDRSRSMARYQAFEEFLDASAGSPIGETSVIAGDILIEPGNPEASRFGPIVVNVESLASDNSMRDSRLRKAYLESATYPEVEMRFGRILDLPEAFEEDEEYTLRLEGDLTVKGITAPTVWDVTFEFDGARLQGSARTEVLMSTYDAGPISIAGLLKTRDEVALSVDLVAYNVAAGAAPGAPAAGRLASAGERSGAGLSFAEEILPTLSSACASCHQPGEVGAGHWSIHRPARLATDDKKAIRILGRRLPESSIVRTSKLLKDWADQGIPADQVREALRNVEHRASFRPPRNDPLWEWWNRTLA